MSREELPHAPDCPGSASCGGLFKCDVCGRAVGWCRGAADNMIEACDDCWRAPPVRWDAVLRVYVHELEDVA